MDSVLTTPAEACHANWEACGLRLADLREETHDTRHGDAQAVLDQEGPETVDRTNEIVSSIYQKLNNLQNLEMYVLQVLENSHERFGSHGGV